VTSRRARNRRDKRAPLPQSIDAMLTYAYASGRADEHDECTLELVNQHAPEQRGKDMDEQRDAGNGN
jgi:hypothetical protein